MTKKQARHPLKSAFPNRTPDLEEWELTAVSEFADKLHGVVMKAASEAVRIALTDEHTDVSWPTIWSDENGFGTGHEVNEPDRRVDPLTIFLCVAFSGEDRKDPVFEFNLRECLKDSIDTCREDGSYADGLARIMDSLRSLADEIATALPTK